MYADTKAFMLRIEEVSKYETDNAFSKYINKNKTLLTLQSIHSFTLYIYI